MLRPLTNPGSAHGEGEELRPEHTGIQCCSSSPFVLKLIVPLSATLSSWMPKTLSGNTSVEQVAGGVVTEKSKEKHDIRLLTLVNC